MACNICHKNFPQDSDLINHMQTLHNLYKCEFCNYCTKQKQHLKRHKLNIHSNSVKCNHCNKKFSSNELLSEHIQSFHQPLTCNICDFYTRNKNSLLRHIKEKHDNHSTHEMKRNSEHNYQDTNSVKRYKSLNHQNEDNASTALDYDMNQVEKEPFIEASQNNGKDSDTTILKINNSFPFSNTCWNNLLIEYRVKLLTVNPITIEKGKSKIVYTNCMIEEDPEYFMFLKPNKDLNLVFEERFILPQKQTVIVTLTNTSEEVKIIPEQFCVGYLIVSHQKTTK